MQNTPGRGNIGTRSTLEEPLITRAVRFIRKMRGESQSALIECSDGHFYVVKSTGNPQGPHVLANEMIGTILCAQMGFSVPPCCIVDVPAGFLQSATDMWFETLHGRLCPQPGLQYGSRFVGALRGPGRALDYVPTAKRHLVASPGALGMCIFDTWANHCDRRQSLLLPDYPAESMSTIFIDQGSLFGGPSWIIEDPAYQVRFRSKELDGLSVSGDEVVRWAACLRDQVPNALIQAIKTVPKEWYTGEIEKLAHTLMARLERVEEIVDYVRGAHTKGTAETNR